jgi:hypothetical protein
MASDVGSLDFELKSADQRGIGFGCQVTKGETRPVRLLLVGSAFLLVSVSAPGFAQGWDDWTYELSPEARRIYAEKRVQVPCSDIGRLLQTGHAAQVYVAVRDAGLFGDRSCARYIERQAKALAGWNAVAFYRLKLGDRRQLRVLARSYDRIGARAGDHETVELFGFLDDWEMSGRRLVRHAQRADGAAAELLCSAIMWRRHLYGEAAFEADWFRVGREEKVNEPKLRHFFESCRRSTDK